MTQILWITGPETLKKEKRRPFSLAKANPLSSIKLLMVNGAGLRRLSLSAMFFFAVIPGTWNFRTGYRTLNTANGMNLTPAQCSYLDSANFAWNTASTQWLM